MRDFKGGREGILLELSNQVVSHENRERKFLY